VGGGRGGGGGSVAHKGGSKRSRRIPTLTGCEFSLNASLLPITSRRSPVTSETHARRETSPLPSGIAPLPSSFHRGEVHTTLARSAIALLSSGRDAAAGVVARRSKPTPPIILTAGRRWRPVAPQVGSRQSHHHARSTLAPATAAVAETPRPPAQLARVHLAEGGALSSDWEGVWAATPPSVRLRACAWVKQPIMYNAACA
jgi:hypothetical protein